jgi:hypothetical protein
MDHTIQMGAVDRVALARDGFQSWSIRHDDASATVTDESLGLELGGAFGERWTGLRVPKILTKSFPEILTTCR